MRRELFSAAALVSALLVALPAAAEDLLATARCEPVASPGRVRCEVLVKAGDGRSLSWADLQLVRASAFLEPLKGRIGPREAEVRADGWHFAFALAAREKGAGEIEVRVRAVTCEGEKCGPTERLVVAPVKVGSP